MGKNFTFGLALAIIAIIVIVVYVYWKFQQMVRCGVHCVKVYDSCIKTGLSHQHCLEAENECVDKCTGLK